MSIFIESFLRNICYIIVGICMKVLFDTKMREWFTFVLQNIC